MAVIPYMRRPLPKDKKTVFLIRHKDGFVSKTAKNTFEVSKAIQEAKRFKYWTVALKMASECRAEEILEVWEDDIRIVTRRYEVARE